MLFPAQSTLAIADVKTYVVSINFQKVNAMKQKKTTLTHSGYEDTPTVDSHNSTFFKNAVTSSVLSIFVLAVWAISQKINQVQPIPYLDEIYHVPQGFTYSQVHSVFSIQKCLVNFYFVISAQEYCKGNFSYVSMLLCINVYNS